MVCAHGVGLTFTGTLRRRTAHAALCLRGPVCDYGDMLIDAALHEHSARHKRAAAPSAARRASVPLRPAAGRAAAVPGAGLARRPSSPCSRAVWGCWPLMLLDAARTGLERAVASAAGDDGSAGRHRSGAAGSSCPARSRVDDPGATLVRDAAAARAGHAAAARGCRLRLRHAPVLRSVDPVRAVRAERDRARARRRRSASRSPSWATIARVIVRCAIAFGLAGAPPAREA